MCVMCTQNIERMSNRAPTPRRHFYVKCWTAGPTPPSYIARECIMAVLPPTAAQLADAPTRTKPRRLLLADGSVTECGAISLETLQEAIDGH